MFKHILFVIDLLSRTATAKKVAIHLAKEGIKHLNVLAVADPRQAPLLLHDLALLALLWRRSGEHEREITEKVERKIKELLEQEVQSLEAAGIQVGRLVRLGRPAEEIIKTAQELRSDLIVMGAPRRWSVLGMGQESTAVEVVRHAPCSVLIVSCPAPQS